MKSSVFRNSVKVLLFSLFMFAPSLWAREIFLNGSNISGSRNQTLKNVTLKIDGEGNIFIEAPHYQVNQENTFIPLSQWQKPKASPQHNTPGKIPDTQSKLTPVERLPTLQEQEGRAAKAETSSAERAQVVQPAQPLEQEQPAIEAKTARAEAPKPTPVKVENEPINESTPPPPAD